MVARDRIELSTSRFSVARSYQLSYLALRVRGKSKGTISLMVFPAVLISGFQQPASGRVLARRAGIWHSIQPVRPEAAFNPQSRAVEHED